MMLEMRGLVAGVLVLSLVPPEEASAAVAPLLARSTFLSLSGAKTPTSLCTTLTAALKEILRVRNRSSPTGF